VGGDLPLAGRDHRAMAGKCLALAALAAALMLSAGCAGDESALCQSLDDLQGSVESLRDVELGEGAVDEVRQKADEIVDDLDAAQEAADEELGPELQNLETAARRLITEAETLVTEGNFTSAALASLASAISSTQQAWEALVAAAPDC
jgi:hypothetical protein